MKRRILTVLFTVVISAGLLSGCGSKESSSSSKADSQTTSETDGFSDGSGSETVTVVDEDNAEVVEENVPVTESTGTAMLDTSTQLTGIHHAQIQIKDYGTLSLELDADTAPITVTNFVKLVQEGFYDGLTFHRIMDGFMIQGGDPSGNGTGGSDETIKGEFSANGVKNDISHVRGTISMARSSEYDSASSQFFIVQTDSTYLDGQYAGFGKVTKGMEIVDQICKDVPSDADSGLVGNKADQPVIESIRILD